MRRLAGIFVVTILALVLWTAFVVTGAREGWWHAEPAAKGDTAGFLRWAEGRYAAESKGNFAMALLQKGRVVQTFYASHGRTVDANSLFQVASMSKWVTAWGVMKLAEQHRIDLDAPVSRYLTRWHLPPSAFDNNAVTVRRLLSHTAGLTDGLGFHGYAPGQIPPSTVQELTHTADAQPDVSGVVRVGMAPGSAWKYSGGGFLILQLLIEDVTHESFNAYMHHAVLVPLGMTESTFVDPDPAHLADFYGPDGARAMHYKFAALSAASLYTSVADMTRFVAAQAPGPDGAPPGRGVLKPATLAAMRMPKGYLYVLPIWGLGHSLFAPNGAGSYVIGHDGNNYPAINTSARVDPATGDGIVVLETGNWMLATEIGGNWVFWQTGTVGLDTLALFDARTALIVLAAGAAAIVLGAILFAVFGRRRTPG